MTKVRLTPSVLDYRQAMAEFVEQVCEEDRIASQDRDDLEELYPTRKDNVEFMTPGLLLPPRVEVLWPELWLENRHLAGIIQVDTSEYFGVMNVYIILEDDRGNRIESGYAMDADEMKNFWGYIPSAPAQYGMTVVVRAIATDHLGGVGILAERVTVLNKAEQDAGSC